MAATIELRAGDARCTLMPDVGGAIAGWWVAEQAMLRTASADADTPTWCSNFVMLPYAGRIADGRFRWAGADHALPPNLPGEAMALHGVGFMLPWSLTEQTATQAVLRLDYAGGHGWPWPITAEQRVTLAADALCVDVALTNLADHAVPGAVGFHPYFDRGDAHLCFGATGYWTDAGRKLPGALAPIPPAWDFAEPRALAGLDIDHCFDGWDGSAQIIWPDRPLALSMHAATSDFPVAVLYVPPGQDFFCFEPMPHVPDAINSGGRLPMPVLAPGETVRRTMRLVARPRNP